MDTTQLNNINKILVADSKSFVLLEVEKLAILGKVNLTLYNGIYLFCLYVLEYRNMLNEYRYTIINNLWLSSAGEIEPVQPLTKPSFMDKIKTQPIALTNKGICK